MICYNYNPDTGEYISSAECSLDPLESNLQGKKIYLLPANATYVAPSVAEEGSVAVWNGTTWEIKEDNRGTKYWLPGDYWQSPAREMKEIGPLPVGAVTRQPEQPEQEKREQRRQELKFKLSALDSQAIRPLRAIAAGTATDADRTKLADLEAQAEKLRAELSALGGN